MSDINEDLSVGIQDEIYDASTVIEAVCRTFASFTDYSLSWESLFFAYLSPSKAQSPCDLQSFYRHKLRPILLKMPWTLEIPEFSLDHIISSNQKPEIFQMLLNYHLGQFSIEKIYNEFILLSIVIIGRLKFLPLIVLEEGRDVTCKIVIIVCCAEDIMDQDPILHCFSRFSTGGKHYLRVGDYYSDPFNGLLEWREGMIVPNRIMTERFYDERNMRNAEEIESRDELKKVAEDEVMKPAINIAEIGKEVEWVAGVAEKVTEAQNEELKAYEKGREASYMLLENNMPENDQNRVVAGCRFSSDLTSISQACIKYSMNSETKQDWTDIFLEYHSENSGNSSSQFNPYLALNLPWKVKLHLSLLKHLQNSNFIERVTYFELIIKLSKGLIICNAEEFYDKNQNSIEYLYMPITMSEPGLEPFFCIFYYGMNENSLSHCVLAGKYNSMDTRSERIQLEDICKDYLYSTQKFRNWTMKKLVYIEEYTKIIPVIPMQRQKIDENGVVEIYALFDFNDQNGISIFARLKEDLIIFDKIYSNKDLWGTVNLLRLEITAFDGCPYELILNETRLKGLFTNTYNEKNQRKLNGYKYQFIFEMNVTTSEAFYKPDSSGRDVIDSWHQLIYFSYYFMVKKDWIRLNEMLSQFIQFYPNYKSKNNPSSIKGINLLLSQYENTIPDDDLFTLLCLIGFTTVENSKLSPCIQYNKILNCLIHEFNEKVLMWKSFNNYQLMINGINILLQYCKKFKDFEIYKLLGKIKDFNLVSNCLISLFNFSKTNGIVYEIENYNEGKILLALSNKMRKVKRKEFINKFIYCAPNFNEIIKVIKENNEYLNSFDAARAIMKQLTNKNYQVNSIANIIIEVNNLDESIKSELKPKQLVNFLIDRIQRSELITSANFENYKIILSAINEAKVFSEFDSEWIIKKFIEQIGFARSKDLLLLANRDLNYFFEEWFKNKCQLNTKNIVTLDNEILPWPENYQEDFASIAVSKLIKNSAAKNCFDYIEEFSNCSTKCISEKFKENLKNKIIEDKRFEESAKDILKKGKYRNYLGGELFDFLIGKIDISQNALKDTIIIAPCKGFIFKYLSKNEKYTNSGFLKPFYVFIDNLLRSFKERTITFKDLEFIYNHDEEKRNIFIKYIQLANSSSFPFLEFEKVLINSLHDFAHFKEDVSTLDKFFSVISFHKMGFEPLHLQFLQLFTIIAEQPLKNFTLPTGLDVIMQTVNFIKLGLDSHAFLKAINTKFKAPSGDIEGSLKNISKRYRNTVKIFTDILSNFEKLKILKLRKHIYGLPFNRIKSEVKLIQNITKVNNNQLEKVISYLNKEKIIVAFYNDLKVSQEYFNSPDQESLKACEKFLNNYKPSFISSYIQYYELALTATLSEIPPEVYPKLFELYAQFNKSKDLICFIKTLGPDELDILYDGLDTKNSSQKLQASTLVNFKELWGFFSSIFNFTGQINQLNAMIIEMIESNKYSNIIIILNECNTHLQALKDLNYEVNNQEQAKMLKIKHIFENSQFKIIEFLEVRLVINNKKYPDEYFCKLNEIIELRDRALLCKNILDHKIDNSDTRIKDLEIYANFVRFVDTICRYLKSIKALKNSLYNDQIDFSKTLTCINGKFEEAESLEKQYSDLDKRWKSTVNQLTKQCYWLNFLYGKRFRIFYSYLFSPNEKYFHRIKPVADFIGKNFKSIKNPGKVVGDIKNQLKIINEIIGGMDHCEKALIMKNLPAQASLIQNPNQIIICETNSFYKGIFSVYYNTNRAVPTISQVYFCNFYSEWGDIKFFLNRCFLNETMLYTIVNPEDLSLENQLKIKLRVIKHSKENSQKSYYLAIVTNSLSSNLVNFLRYQQEIPIINVFHYQLLSEEAIAEIIRDLTNNIIVYSSAYVGLGKSTIIRERVKELKLDYIEINIAGNINYAALGKILKHYQRKTPTAFHIQINYIEDYTLIHQLIFCLTVFRQYCSSKTIFSIPENSRIFIEVANTYNDFLHINLSFLALMPQNHIQAFSLSNLILDERIYFVTNMLVSYDSKKIDKESCNFTNKAFSYKQIQEILLKYFEPNCLLPTYHQFNTFLNILYTLFKNFENSSYSTELIKIQIMEYPELGPLMYNTLRSTIIRSIIETSKEFTSKCVNSVKNSQISSINIISNKPSSTLLPEFSSTIKWENSNHFTMLFFEQGDSLCIYRHSQLVPEDIKRFLFIQRKLIESYKNKTHLNFNTNLLNSAEIEDYLVLTSKQLLEKLIEVYLKFCLKTKLKALRGEDKKVSSNSDINLLKEIRRIELTNTGYVLTPDNFLKMNLIYLRCISNIPLFIMGETGCGKTSLIRFFVREILQDELEIICIHSGVTWNDIDKKVRDLNERAMKAPKKRFWVFFDEFNTSDCIGMICDIICDRKIKDTVLVNNLIFVGACNPYRAKSIGNMQNENVGIKKLSILNNKNSNLVHIVRPLPDKAIEFVWDFGVLKPNEVKVYIASMLESCSFSHKILFNELICTAHEYFQTNEDASSVSLRDISRFIRLSEWFKASLEQRLSLPASNPMQHIPMQELEDLKNSISELDINFKAGLLAYFHCYFLRISSELTRDDFLCKILTVINKYTLKNLTKEMLQNVIKCEQYDFLLRMIIPKQTALNLALMENIFALVPCIFNKIPILICGKPGCSKSLALQIISSSLRGDKSHDPYLKTLPELQSVCFQGSDSCTSEGILEVFEKAKRFNINKHILPVVIFDEIGLAEISRHNPLKVLHSLLETENCEVAFIGISNWRLDSSKMNRTLYLARPDPDQNDLKETAIAIYKSVHSDVFNESKIKIIRDLAETYYQMKSKQKDNEFSDFYGLRDFYHMIKYVSKGLSDDIEATEVVQIACRSIDRNFGGNLKGAKIMRSLFSASLSGIAELSPSSKVQDLINENLSDPDSRYLMIICQRDVSSYLIETLQQSSSARLKDRRLISGSTFEQDLLKDDSNFRILSDIILFMEQGISIILQDMDSVYSSLYDLFNQSFSKSSPNTKKYCRIALGAQFNPRCFIHEDFKVLVFMDDDEECLRKADAPFLNRFEKHYVRLSDIITPSQLKVSNEICNWVESITSQKGGLSLQSIFPCFSKESVNLLTCYLNKTTNEEELIERIKMILIKTSSVDLKLVTLLDKENNLHSLREIWNGVHSRNFIEYVDQKLNNKKFQRYITITYDSSSIDIELKKHLNQ